MLDFEFCIDTGKLPPLCCRQSVYGFRENKIMTKSAILEDNFLITNFEGVWRSLLLLTAKSHQESCTDDHAFIWRLCASYRSLNSITLGFEFSIPHCADSIEDLGNSCDPLSIISLDA